MLSTPTLRIIIHSHADMHTTKLTALFIHVVHMHITYYASVHVVVPYSL